MDKDAAFAEIAQELAALHAAKNADYGDSFGETFRKLGPISAVTRIADKTNRLCTLAVRGAERKVADETVEDTLKDLASYAIMALVELRARRQNDEDA